MDLRLLFAVFALPIASWPAPAKRVPVRTDSGLVLGAQADGLTVYKGIPFAAPPVGRLRWREPQSVKPWTGLRSANKFAPAAMQVGVSMPGETPPTVSEDCLYLNLWEPTARTGRPLPVMVWIYGGGFTNGSASMPLYWGDRLARKGIIVVTFGYRVGPFGFLVLPELKRESPHHTSGNYAILDQLAALKWVHRNIKVFGGDPRRVTIAGQSAGGSSVAILTSSPLAKGLFQRAIGQSGGMFEPIEIAPRARYANAEHEGEAYAASLGVKSVAELRALPAARIMEGNAGAVSHPVVEPYVLPDSPYNTFVACRENDVSILVGSNADEARSLLANQDKIKAATFAEDIAKSWGPLPPQLFAAYPYKTDAEALLARLAFERDLRFGWGMWAWARLVAASKGRSRVYYYHFTHKPPFPADSVRAGWGASHYAELWYTFDHLSQESWRWTPADRKLADVVSGYWVNFVKSGDPNGPGLPRWPTFTASENRVLYLDDDITVKGVANLKTLQAIDDVYTQARGAAFGLPPKR
ncbi:MAG: carboxylesterase/lipase family protein [Fimbriimonadaceae bacterium]